MQFDTTPHPKLSLTGINYDITITLTLEDNSEDNIRVMHYSTEYYTSLLSKLSEFQTIIENTYKQLELPVTQF